MEMHIEEVLMVNNNPIRKGAVVKVETKYGKTHIGKLSLDKIDNKVIIDESTMYSSHIEHIRLIHIKNIYEIKKEHLPYNIVYISTDDAPKDKCMILESDNIKLKLLSLVSNETYTVYHEDIDTIEVIYQTFK